MGYTQMDGCTRGRENADYPDEVVAEKNKRLEILRELGDKNRLDDLCADVIVKPSYHIVNAFTMCLVGPKDFTPGAFDCNDGHLQKRMKFNAPLPSTINYQVALCNLIPSGILCLMDAPESYEQYPDMFEFIQKLPQTFDETKILDAEIGEYVIIARRKGDQWFISGITNEISREYSINFDFLGDDHFSGKLYLDNQGNHYLGEKEKHEISDLNEINPESVKSVYMVPGGGFNIWLEKVK
jgi:alpha-glucosidase